MPGLDTGIIFVDPNSNVIMSVDKTNKRIGINTADPTVSFEVTGNAKITGDLTVTGDIGLDDVTLDDASIQNLTISSGGSIVTSVANTFVPVILSTTKQALSGAGAVNITAYKTDVTTTGANALTLASGAVIGQLKKIQLIVDGGDGTLTFNSTQTIVFADVGDTAELIWNGTAWVVIDTYNCADGATAPVYTP